MLFKRGLRLFKGLCLSFLPNVPGAIFILGGTFIPDSRVINDKMTWKYVILVGYFKQQRINYFPDKKQVYPSNIIRHDTILHLNSLEDCN